MYCRPDSVEGQNAKLSHVGAPFSSGCFSSRMSPGKSPVGSMQKAQVLIP